MSALVYLIPISLALGAVGLIAFLWTLRDGQYEDMEGAARRIITDDDKPLRRDRSGRIQMSSSRRERSQASR